MKIVKTYCVIKEVTITKSREDGSVMFLDNDKRIYFIDKKKPTLYDTLDLDKDIGKKLLVWVTKELDKVGFVTMSINGVMLSEYLNKLLINNTEFINKCLDRELTRDEMQLFNYIYNHDTVFRDHMYPNDEEASDSTQYIRSKDTYVSEDSNIKTPTAISIARDYLLNRYVMKTL